MQQAATGCNRLQQAATGCNRLQQHGLQMSCSLMLIFTLAQVMLVHQDEAPNIYAHIAKAQFQLKVHKAQVC